MEVFRLVKEVNSAIGVLQRSRYFIDPTYANMLNFHCLYHIILSTIYKKGIISISYMSKLSSRKVD